MNMGKCQSVGRILPNLLLQILEEGAVEKLQDRDLQPVADLLDGGNGSGGVSAADDVVQRGLRDAADGGKLVERNIVRSAQLQYAKSDRFANSHNISPNSNGLILLYCILGKNITPQGLTFASGCGIMQLTQKS